MTNIPIKFEDVCLLVEFVIFFYVKYFLNHKRLVLTFTSCWQSSTGGMNGVAIVNLFVMSND